MRQNCGESSSKANPELSTFDRAKVDTELSLAPKPTHLTPAPKPKTLYFLCHPPPRANTYLAFAAALVVWVVRVRGDDGELRLWHYTYVYITESRLMILHVVGCATSAGSQIFELILQLI